MHSIMHSCFFFSTGWAKLLNIYQILDNCGPTRCQILECFSTFDKLASIWCKMIGSTSLIRQLWPPQSSVLLNFDRHFLCGLSNPENLHH